eukprot:1756900-Amphidinium_carterae.3
MDFCQEALNLKTNGTSPFHRGLSSLNCLGVMDRSCDQASKLQKTQTRNSYCCDDNVFVDLPLLQRHGGEIGALGPSAQGSQEVVHRGTYGLSLLVLRATSTGQPFLEHFRTGERVSLQHGTALLFNAGWGFLRIPAQAPSWAKSLLNVCKTPTQQKLLFWKDQSREPVWLSYWRAHFASKLTQWEGGDGVLPMKSLHVAVFSVSTDGWKIFLSMRDIQEAVPWHCQSCSHSKWLSRRMSSWKIFLSTRNLHAGHILHPDTGAGAECKLKAWHASLPACLAWLAVLTRRSQSSMDKKHLVYLLTGLLRNLNRGGRLHIHHDVMGSYDSALVGPSSALICGLAKLMEEQALDSEPDWPCRPQEVSGARGSTSRKRPLSAASSLKRIGGSSYTKAKGLTGAPFHQHFRDHVKLVK